LTGNCSSARSIVSANSVSVIRTFAPPCSSMKAIASASRRVLSVLSTPPVIGTAKCASIISGVLAAIKATVSPAPMPALTSAEAKRRQRA
jgi:hypothetical protein